jgi:hypothetical protein
MSEIEHEYEYRPRWWDLLLIVAFFGAGVALGGYKAVRPEPERIRVVSAVMCALGALYLVWFGALAVAMLAIRHRVALTSTALLLPKSWWSRDEEAIDYQAIRAVSAQPPARPLRLYVKHTGGQRCIAAGLMSSRAAFAELHELLTARVAAVQGSPHN